MIHTFYGAFNCNQKACRAEMGLKTCLIVTMSPRLNPFKLLLSSKFMNIPWTEYFQLFLHLFNVVNARNSVFLASNKMFINYKTPPENIPGLNFPITLLLSDFWRSFYSKIFKPSDTCLSVRSTARGSKFLSWTQSYTDWRAIWNIGVLQRCVEGCPRLV